MILAILMILVGAAATVLCLRYDTHMLQLSSYQFQGYFRFLKGHQQQFGLHFGAAACLIMIGFLGGTGIGAIGYTATTGSGPIIFGTLTILFFLCTIYQYLPRPAKKKFVVTKRVQRLFITDAVLAVILVLICVLVSIGNRQDPLRAALIRCIILGAVIALLPLYTALTNLINLPIEKRINRWYIDDARRILKEHDNLRIIGITGSYGKTSVKYYLTTLLSEQFRVLMTPESFNTPMGIVRTIRGDLQPMHQIFVCEMGARHLHDIKEITDIVDPDDGLVTSIGYQHLETFHSLENIVSTKYELLDSVEKKKQSDPSHPHLKFVNGDCEIIRENMKHPDAITYGLSENNDYVASNVEVTGAGTSFTVTAPNGETGAFTMKLVGRHNVENVMGAIAAAHTMGVPMDKLRMAVRRLQSVPHRLELTRNGNVAILDDAYNSNPAGAKVALETLDLFNQSEKILVTPGMVELGEKEAELNKEFGRQAAVVCDYILLVGEAQTKPIREGALEAGFDAEKIMTFDSFLEASKRMYELDAGREKVILLENDLPDNYTK